MHFENGEVYPKENNGDQTYTSTSLIICKSKPKIIIFSREVRKSEL